MKTDITKRQQQVLDQIERLTAKHKMPPTLLELGVPLGITTTHGVYGHLLALRRKGRVTWVENKSRPLRVITQPQRRGMPLLSLEELSA